jgi:uridine kinase
VTANLIPAIEKIIAARRAIPRDRAVLVAISGIDASGKGYITAQLADVLQQRGFRAANINIDSWLNLPHVRFAMSNLAEHFYLRAIRFGELFRDLILPLRDRRSITLEMDVAEETATSYRKRLLAYVDVEIVLLEGIYLLKREFQDHYDLSLWIECSFDTALERALARGQEGLPPSATIHAYRTIYFPAQEIHFARDNPKAAAAMIIPNDPRLNAS